MLKSVVFLLVLISFITTPTQAYEAYNSLNLDLRQEMEAAEAAKAEPEVYELCEIAADKAEADYQIKPNLLQTIASVESGRWNAEAGKRVAWPWTVHAKGKGRYYKTKAEAIAAVQDLQRRGITNIDVGCMQINLKYHGTAFKNLDEAFDPQKNANYSAQFLRSLYKRNKQNWTKTAMHYHSRNLRRGTNYKNRLEKHYAEYVREDGGAAKLF